MVNHPITISLGTSDPALARFLAQRLAGKWDEMMDTIWIDKALSATERVALMKKAADQEIGVGTRDWFMRAPKRVDIATHRFHALAYELSRTIPLCKADPAGLLDIELMQVPKGCAPGICEEFPDDYHAGRYQKTLFPDEIAMAAELLTKGDTSTLPEEARQVIWRGKVEARMRLAYAIEAGIADQPDFVERLLDDPDISAKTWQAAFGDRPAFRGALPQAQEGGVLEKERLNSAAVNKAVLSVQTASPTAAGSEQPTSAPPVTNLPVTPHVPSALVHTPCPYLERDTRPFSQQIDRIVAAQLAADNWASDEAQARRVLRSFAWITGDKETHSYRPSDITHFVKVISSLPTSFRWAGRFDANAPAFADICHTLPVASDDNRRSNRTINRDLTILSAASSILTKDSWKTGLGNSPIMDFGSARLSAAGWGDDEEDDDRVPWTEQHVRTLFHLPLYVGCVGAVKRLRPGKMVHQDGAFWVPLLIAYSGLSREEACGIELDEIQLDGPIPFIAIRRNMTKSIDGKKAAGLKNRFRKRLMPLHPELLRLGFAAYVQARRREAGHPALFPELYVPGFGRAPHVKRGGTRFYARAGQHILNAVDAIDPLPRTSDGKRADFHSIRTYVASKLSVSEAKKWVVQDLMGHTRDGTTDEKYNKPAQVEGRDAYLRILHSALVSALPVVTSHLKPRAPQLLLHAKRSCTGSPPRNKPTSSKSERFDK
jgi:Phage integrase family